MPLNNLLTRVNCNDPLLIVVNLFVELKPALNIVPSEHKTIKSSLIVYISTICLFGKFVCATKTGVVELVVFPFPKRPLLFKPHAYNLPSLVKANIFVLLGDTFTMVLPKSGLTILFEAPIVDNAVNSIGSF